MPNQPRQVFEQEHTQVSHLQGMVPLLVQVRSAQVVTRLFEDDRRNVVHGEGAQRIREVDLLACVLVRTESIAQSLDTHDDAQFGARNAGTRKETIQGSYEPPVGFVGRRDRGHVCGGHVSAILERCMMDQTRTFESDTGGKPGIGIRLGDRRCDEEVNVPLKPLEGAHDRSAGTAEDSQDEHSLQEKNRKVSMRDIFTPKFMATMAALFIIIGHISTFRNVWTIYQVC